MKKLDLSVILPCYNEMEILYESIKLLIQFLDNTKLNYELILIDDCSTDGTRQEIPKLADKHSQIVYKLHEKNIGRGGTVSEGIKMAKGEVAGFLDIDLETPQWYILPAYIMIKEGADVVCASRIYKFSFKKIIREILSKGYKKLMKSMLGVNFSDSEAGFKFFNKQRILPVLKQIKNKGWFWDTEIMVRSYYDGCKIRDIPTLFLRKDYKTSTVKIFSDSWDYFLNLRRFRHVTKRLKKNKKNER